MGDEMKQTETGMPSLTLEPELVMEQEKEPEVQAQLMEVTQEMNPVQQKMAQTVLTPEEQQMVENFAGHRLCSMEPEHRRRWLIFLMKH